MAPQTFNWPPVGSDSDHANAKALYEAKVGRVTADDDARLELQKAFVDGVVEVAKGSIDRARAGAELVQKGAAAIVTIYTAVLGVSFSVAERPLPSRGVIAPVLLGVAVVLSTVYLAYQSKPDDDVDELDEKPGSHATAIEVARRYVIWTRSGASQRRYWLRASVVSLGLALIFLPAPFVTFKSSDAKAATATKTAWPPKPTEVQDPALQRILYAAQVKEAATSRAKPATVAADGHDGEWALAGAIALILVFAAPAAISAIVGDATAAVAVGKIPTPMFME
jgi:hypothetical protein